MRSKSPKMYWQYISSLGKPKRHVDLDNDMFYNFKDLNAHVTDDETVPDVNLQHNLDVDITADEITKCFKNLNCGKASGPDSVLNEYIVIPCINYYGTSEFHACPKYVHLEMTYQ